MTNRARILLGLVVGLILGMAILGIGLRVQLGVWFSEPALRDKKYYAQQAEDVVIASIFRSLRIDRPTYLDVGAFDPILSSNTYLFYERGSHGVLVEPNPSYRVRLEKVRPRDKVLAIGIGVTEQAAADYYVFRNAAQHNTFSKEVADRLSAEHGPQIVEQVLRLPLVDINTVIADNFEATPDLLSIDVEGLDLDILKTLDFEKYRPPVICVETLVVGTREQNDQITAFLTGKGYLVRGMTYVNTIFVDARRLSQGGSGHPSAAN